MKPINRAKQKKQYLFAGFVSYLFVLFLAGHIGKVEFVDVTSFAEAFEHLRQQPFDIFPLNWDIMKIAALLGLIPPLLIHAEFLRKRDLRPGVESGSAHWHEDLKGFYKEFVEMGAWPAIFERNFLFRKIKKLIQKIDVKLSKTPVFSVIYKRIAKAAVRQFQSPHQGSSSKNMILSKEVFLSMDQRKTQRNCNTLIIGGSGTGKSRFEAKPNILQANASFVVTDPSGELLESVGSFLEREGYEIRVFNLVQMEHSHCYNPFHYIRNQAGVPMMINTLIKNTNPKDSTKGDPFWEKSETALLMAICYYLISECNKEDQNFTNVMKLLRCASAVEGQENVDSVLDIMFKDLEARDPDHIGVKSYKTFKAAGGGKTAQSILISCLVRLQTFDLDDIRNLTSIDNIDLGSMGEKKVALFCITPSADTTYNYLVALLYSQMFETLYFKAENVYDEKRLPHHVRFIMDEFANIANIPDFEQKLSTMRKYEISCTIIIQALSQLKSLYKDNWDVLVSNCDSQIFLGGSDPTTLEFFSKALGKETIRSRNSSRSFGRQGSHSVSYNTTGRELMTTDELRLMDNRNCIIIIRGLPPFFATKYPYQKHPNFRYTADCNKKYKYNVRTTLRTGQNVSDMREPNKAIRLFREAQIADTREAEREHRLNSRPVVKRTNRGEPCFRPTPMTEVIPHLGVPQDQLTQQQLEERQAAAENIVVERIHIPQQEEARAEYAQVIEEELDSFTAHQHDFMMENYGSDEEQMFSTDTGVFDDLMEEERGE